MSIEFLNQLFKNHFTGENLNDGCGVLSRNLNISTCDNILGGCSDRGVKEMNSDEKLQHDITAYTNSLDNDMECPDCEGIGTFDESNCCDAKIIHSDICSACGEHCDRQECERCDGTGTIEKIDYGKEYEPDED